METMGTVRTLESLETVYTAETLFSGMLRCRRSLSQAAVTHCCSIAACVTAHMPDFRYVSLDIETHLPTYPLEPVRHGRVLSWQVAVQRCVTDLVDTTGSTKGIVTLRLAVQ